MPRHDYERNSVFERLACRVCRRSWRSGYDSCPHCGAGREQQASLPFPIVWWVVIGIALSLIMLALILALLV